MTAERPPTVGSAPPNSVRPNLIAVCTNGGRHKSRELLRVALYWQGDRPTLVEPMSAQRGGEDRPWTPIALRRAPDGHQVIDRRCPDCRTGLQRNVAKLTADLAANSGRCVVVDLSTGETRGC